MAESKRILVVDDDRIIADTLVLIMRKHGFNATACYDGHEAIDCARTFQPDLLIADYDLPCLNGRETALGVKTERPACQVVFLSALPAFALFADGTLKRDLEFAWINKPIGPHDLLVYLDNTLKAAA